MCEVADIYCAVENCEYIKINKNNITNVYDIYEKNKNKKNILIDSRCTEIIIYCFFKYLHDILIYNVNDNRVINIFIWAKFLLKLNNNCFNISYLKKILFIYLFLMFYLKNIRNKPLFSSNDIHKIIINSAHNEVLTLDFLINYINVSYTMSNFDINLYKEIYNIIRLKNLSNIKPISEKYTITDIQNCLKQLINNEIVLNI